MLLSHYWYNTSACIFAAYGGEFCEEDRNGCSEIQCFEGVECLDVPAPGVGAMCGACPEGYTGDGEKCFGKRLYLMVCIGNSIILLLSQQTVDIDECEMDPTLCEQICNNTVGSYECKCEDGYRLVAGTNRCAGNMPSATVTTPIQHIKCYA